MEGKYMKKTTVLTIILALIWCMIIVLATLSPLAQTGGTSNQFGDMGMWADIGLILVLFLLPQYFYDKGSKGAKIVLAVIIGTFILGVMVIFGLVGLFLLKGVSISLILIAILSVCYLLLSIGWYILSFRN